MTNPPPNNAGNPLPPDNSTPAWHDFVNRHPLARDALTLIGGTGAAQAITLLAYLFLARIYDDTAFGMLALVLSIGTLLTTVAAARYEPAIMLPEEDREAKTLVAACIKLLGWFSLAVFVIAALAFFLAHSSAPVFAPLLWMLAFVVLSGALTSVWTYWLNRKGRYRAISLNRVQSSSVSALAPIFFGLAGWTSAFALVLGRLLGMITGALGLAWRARDSRFSFEEDRSSQREILRKYRKMPLLNAPAAIADAVRINGINIMLGWYFSAAVLGQFSLAWQIVQAPLALINGALAQVYFRELSRTKPGGMRLAVGRITGRSLLIGLLPFGLLAGLSWWLFPFLFGSNWGLAGTIAQILTPWLYLNLATSPISTVFIVTGRQGVALPFALVFMAVPLGLIFLSSVVNWSILVTIGAVSAAMAAMLVVYIFLALWVAAGFDRGQTAVGE
ncbi:MAG: oligosaccharide flippase family protein [Mobiluncus porci]|uniref:oligosaccharide flippase family protein n=1 Tax=Mobiluncus porci TaxID=2652278 RepID=UPI0023F172D5|nr:oligosaccharide flippase family protein [Mobiluncus porci]MDD7542516.1 oligosaccharide flippase family protein [Mobiluncus porci]MDY5748813.1 oligosaccharide flippase family protein [Mobiluncus porci]